MLFKTLTGSEENIFCNDYKISWQGRSASKFQFRAKQFFYEHFRHLEWFEEFPLNGQLRALRVDFMCRFKDRWGRNKCVLIELDSDMHFRKIDYFHSTDSDFLDMIDRDNSKTIWAKVNNIQLIRMYSDDEPFTLDWFNETYNYPFGTQYAT